MAHPRGRVVVPAKRQATWSTVIIESRALGIGTAKTLGVTAIGAAAGIRSTVARFRGSAYCHLDAGAALDTMTVALGLIIVKDTAFAAGVASMPGPFSEPEASWIWHHIFSMGPAVTATDDGGDISRNDRVVIDSKAMRKIQDSETIAFVWEGQILAGSPTFDGYAAVRFLLLET